MSDHALIENNPDLLEALAANLARRIEDDLASGPPMYSKCAYTHRRTKHRGYRNGIRYDGRDPLRPYVSAEFTPDEMVDRAYTAAKAYRQEICGPANLTWRVEPRFEYHDGYLELYMRLCFEPALESLGHGVWIESK